MKPSFLTSRLMALTLLASPSTAEAGTQVWKSKDPQTLWDRWQKSKKPLKRPGLQEVQNPQKPKKSPALPPAKKGSATS